MNRFLFKAILFSPLGLLVAHTPFPFANQAQAHGPNDPRPTSIVSKVKLAIDTHHDAFHRQWLDPTPITPALADHHTNPTFVYRVLGKDAVGRRGLVQIEIIVENTTNQGFQNLVLQVLSPYSPVYDLSQDPYNETPLQTPIALGGLGPRALARVTLALPKAIATVPLSFTITAHGGYTAPSASSPIGLSPQGDEVWSAHSDYGALHILSLASNIGETINVGGAPSSLAFTPDGQYVAVAFAHRNEVAIYHRATRAVVQRLGTKDGLGRELRHIIMDPHGKAFYVSSFVDGTVTKVLNTTNGFLVDKTLVVGARPTAMALKDGGATLLVPHFLPRGTVDTNEAWVSVVDTQNFQLAHEMVLHDEFNLKGGKLDCLAKAFSNPVTGTVKPEDVTMEGVHSQLTGVFVDPSGRQAWLSTTRVPGSIVVLERGPQAAKYLTQFGGIKPGMFSAPFLVILDASRPKHLKPLLGPSLEIPAPQSLTRCFRSHMEIEFIDGKLLAGNNEQTNPFLNYHIGQAALGSLGLIKQITFTPGGRRALLLSHVSDEIAVYDGTTFHPITKEHFKLSGSNPQGMVLNADGTKAYVVYENSPYISILDTSAYANPNHLPHPFYVPYRYGFTARTPVQPSTFLSFPLIRHIAHVPQLPPFREVSQVPLLVADPLDPQMRRGKVLFSTANPDKHNMTLSRLGTCATCHPEGRSDGSSWATMEGSRRTLSIAGGTQGRGWLHASATHANAAEFLEVVVLERLGGRLPPADLHALARYVDTGIPRLQHPTVDENLAAKGQEIFQAQCAQCHFGPHLTSGIKKNGEPILYDLGTASPNHRVAAGPFYSKLLRLFGDFQSALILDSIRGDRDLGPGDTVQKILDFRQRPTRKAGQFKAPPLTNVWDQSLFFHDGQVDTLRGATARINGLLNIGLQEDDLDAVTEFLKTL